MRTVSALLQLFLCLFLFWILLLAEGYGWLILFAVFLVVARICRVREGAARAAPIRWTSSLLHKMEGFFCRLPLWPLILLAVGLRFAWGAYFGTNPFGDYKLFYQYALDLAGGDFAALGYSKSPMTVLYYGILFRVTGDSLVCLYLFNALFGGLQTFLVYRITVNLFESEAAGRFSALVTALFPSLVIYSSVMSSDMPFTTLLLLCLWMGGSLLRQGPAVSFTRLARQGLFLSLLIASLHLTRNLGIIIGLWIFVVILAAARFSFARKALLGFYLVMGLFLFLSPQICYNWVTYHTFSIHSSRWNSLVLLHGTNRATQGGWSREYTEGVKERFADRPWKEATRFARETALERIAKDPLDFARFALTRKFHRMWCSDGYSVGWSLNHSDHVREMQQTDPDYTVGRNMTAWKKLCECFYCLILFIALCALSRPGLRQMMNHPEFVILGGLVFLAFSLHFFIEVQGRYHFYITYLFAVLAGASLTQGINNHGKQRGCV